MSAGLQVAAYRRLTACYPNSFRAEYRDDLVATFAQQLRDDGATRTWARAISDLIVTVPSQHLEAHMHRPSTTLVTVIAATVAVAATAMAAIVGGGMYVMILLVAAIGAGIVAVLARNADRPVVVPGNSRSWMKFLGAGTGLLAILIVLLNVPKQDVELTTVQWSLMMLTLMLSISLIAAGLVLGITRRLQRGNVAPRS